MKKYIISLVTFLALAGLPGGAGAATVTELQTQLQALQSQLNQLNSGTAISSACANIVFSRNLKVGTSGADVKCLQQLLNKEVAGQVPQTGVFGVITKAAVIAFQEKYRAEVLAPSGLARGTGMVGLATRIKLNALLVVVATPVVAPVPVKTQSEMEIAAIAKASPAVVSINITKQVPEYEVGYEEVFSGGSSWSGLKVEIPVYKPTGRMVTKKVGAGSGFLITKDGYILTNKHVVADESAQYLVVASTGAQQAASVIYKDAQKDVAIIKIDGGDYPVLALGDSSTLQAGQPIIAIGNALGQFSNSVSLGIVSGLDRTIRAADANGVLETLEGVIQTNAAINPGNSGGPLLDLEARVVGINVAQVQGHDNISFSIPIDQVKPILKLAPGL